MARHVVVVWSGAVVAACGVSTCAARDQRPQSAALGLRHVRVASRAAGRHESGPDRAQRGGHQPAVVGHGGTGAGTAPDTNPGGVARRLGCRSGARGARRLRAVHDHLCTAGRDRGCDCAAAQPAQDRPNRYRARCAARRAAAVVANADLIAGAAVRRAGLGARWSGHCSAGLAATARPRGRPGPSAALGWRRGLRRHLDPRPSRTRPTSSQTRSACRLGRCAGRSRHGCALVQIGGVGTAGGHRGAPLGWQLPAGRLRRLDPRRGHGSRRILCRCEGAQFQPATVLAGIAVYLVSVGGAVWWVWTGASGPIERTRLDAIPPYVMNALKSDARPRLLAIDLSDGTARYSVLADDHLRLGDADRGFTFGGSVAAREQVDDLVVRLVAGTADSDINPQLTDLGIGYVWVTGANEDITARIDNTPGLGTASGNERGIVWKLQPAVARTVITDGAARLPVGPPPAPVSTGTQERQLQIGESADLRWRAEMDGETLVPVADGWQQVFALPGAAGTVRYALPSVMPWLLPVQGLVLLVAGVLAAPATRRPEVRDPAKSARRAATLSELA